MGLTFGPSRKRANQLVGRGSGHGACWGFELVAELPAPEAGVFGELTLVAGQGAAAGAGICGFGASGSDGWGAASSGWPARAGRTVISNTGKSSGKAARRFIRIRLGLFRTDALPFLL
jgi:hypothetical protein